MKRHQKDLRMKMLELRHQLRMLLRQNARERHRSGVLLRDVERNLEDRFAKLDSIQSANEFAAMKLRKSPLREISRQDY